MAAKAVNTSNPTTVVGSGTAASCTNASLASAVAKGGIITFNCGSDPATIPITSTLQLKTDRDTVVDGGNRVTLDGQGSVQIFNWNYVNWQSNIHVFTLQHVQIANAKATPTRAIPSRPAPCSQGYFDGQGGAIYMRDGILHAIDVTFVNNQAALLGPDTGGGAIYLLGVIEAYVSGCTFHGNKGANAGAVGVLFGDLHVFNSLFDGNEATGAGANNDDASLCSIQVDPPDDTQHEVGSGGNGGAIYGDGGGAFTVCGTQIRNNHANAFGAVMFKTGDGSLAITDSKLFENKQCFDWWEESYQGVHSTGISDNMSSVTLTSDSITAPANWSATTDSVCKPLLSDYCNTHPGGC